MPAFGQCFPADDGWVPALSARVAVVVLEGHLRIRDTWILAESKGYAAPLVLSPLYRDNVAFHRSSGTTSPIQESAHPDSTDFPI